MGWQKFGAWDKFALETKLEPLRTMIVMKRINRPLSIGQVANQSLEWDQVKLSEFVAKNYTWFRLWDSTGSNSFKKNGTELMLKWINIRLDLEYGSYSG